MRKILIDHQLQTSDEQFITALHLPRRSVDAIASHFRTRKNPAWSFYSHGSAWHQTDAVGSVLEKADNLLDNRLRNSWPPHQWLDLNDGRGGIDWSRSIEQARTSITRHTWLCELSTAFALSGRTKYITKALELMKSYVEQSPFILDPRFVEDHDTYFGGEGNSTQTTSYRLFRWIDFLHCGAIHAPGVCSDDDVFWIVKQIWFYTMQFARLLGDPLRRDNHHLLDHGHVPFVIGLAFPEFDISRQLVREGARVIRHHFGHNLLPDGGNAEHSAEYQYHVLFHYAHPCGVAKANGYKLFSAAQLKQLRKWIEFSARAGKPDGMLPSIGDSPGRPLLHLFGSLATPLMDKKLAAMARGLGCVPGTHQFITCAGAARMMKRWKPKQRLPFGVSEYYTTARAHRPCHFSGTAFPKGAATCQYPHGGYTFFRSEWSPSADYLAVSHFTGDYGAHAHWDMMSFLLHTQGKTLIGDPAAWLYVSSRFHGHGGDFRKLPSPSPAAHRAALPYRGYSYSVNAHNCLVMNDDTLKPLEAMNHGTFWGGWPPKHGLGIFHAPRGGGPIEVAEVWHDANYPTRHRRFFVHIVGIGFALVDLLSKRPNLSPHQYSQYFHFEGDVEISPETPATGLPLRASAGDASCLIVPGSETESRWRTFRDPFLEGDVYGVANHKGTPWIAELTRRIRGQAVFTHFILTRDAAQQTNASCRYLGERSSPWLDWQHDRISANALDLGPLGTLLLASAPYRRPVECDELTTDAELAIVHLTPRRRIKSWLMLRGRKLIVGKKTLHAGAKHEITASE